MTIDVRSFGRSVASLDADLIDLNNVEELVDAVFVATSNICTNGDVDLIELTELLIKSLSGSDGNEFALLLATTTGVDWLYDEETKEMLKLVTEKFLEGIKYYSISS